MPKSKKRRHQDLQVVGLSSSSSPSASAIDSVLAELEGLAGVATNVVAPAETAASAKKAKVERCSQPPSDAVNIDKQLWDPSIRNVVDPGPAFREQVQRWNTAFQIWANKSSTYTAGLLPSFEVEVARHFQVEQLSKYLLEESKLKMPSFERWLIDSKVEERKRASGIGTFAVNPSDAVLSHALPTFSSSQRLAEEMQESGMDAPKSKKIIKELCRRAQQAIGELEAQEKRFSKKIPLKKGDRIELERHDQIYALIYHCKKWKEPFVIRIAAAHYDKLRAMFVRVHGGELRLTEAGKATKGLHAFHYILMTVLLRYSSLSGGQLLLELKGGGMQGAIHGRAFHVLRDFFPKLPLLECFASPLNAFVPHFGSVFEDIDWHFGSVGDFLRYDINAGCCEANPPFTPGLMSAMVDRVEHNLQQADRAKRQLTFVVIVPTVPDDYKNAPAAKRLAGPPFHRMTKSPHCRAHIVLNAREHGYIEGAQHLRLTRYKYSIFATSVIVLQSQAAIEQPLGDDFEPKIREAFMSRHLEEQEERKGAKSNEKESV